MTGHAKIYNQSVKARVEMLDSPMGGRCELIGVGLDLTKLLEHLHKKRVGTLMVTFEWVDWE